MWLFNQEKTPPFCLFFGHFPISTWAFSGSLRRALRIEQVTRWSVARTLWIPPNGKAWMERSHVHRAGGEIFRKVATSKRGCEGDHFFLVAHWKMQIPWKSKIKQSGWSRMIHVKDSQLPRDKDWSTWTCWVNVFYIIWVVKFFCDHMIYIP